MFIQLLLGLLALYADAEGIEKWNKNTRRVLLRKITSVHGQSQLLLDFSDGFWLDFMKVKIKILLSALKYQKKSWESQTVKIRHGNILKCVILACCGPPDVGSKEEKNSQLAFLSFDFLAGFTLWYLKNLYKKSMLRCPWHVGNRLNWVANNSTSHAPTI